MIIFIKIDVTNEIEINSQISAVSLESKVWTPFGLRLAFV